MTHQVGHRENARIRRKSGGKAFPNDYNWICPLCGHDCRKFEDTCPACEHEAEEELDRYPTRKEC